MHSFAPFSWDPSVLVESVWVKKYTKINIETVLVESVWVKKYTKINIEKMKSGKS